MGLSYACGLALANKKRGEDKRIYVLVGNGELNEGSNWEAVLLAKQQELGSITVIVDDNGMQSDGKSTEILDVDLASVFKSFGWQIVTCDGHSVSELLIVFESSESEKPKAVLAKTVKGKGVSFMENNNAWHHNRFNDEQYQNAVREVESIGL